MADPNAPKSAAEVVAGEPAKVDFSRDMSYGDYLHLDEVLGAQHLRSGAHDEMLFIVQHQSELWMKLLLHELEAAIAAVAATSCSARSRCWRAVSKIMEQLVHAWDVLATMTPTVTRSSATVLGPEPRLLSSHQYRAIEFMLGNKNAAMPGRTGIDLELKMSCRIFRIAQRSTTNSCATCSRAAAPVASEPRRRRAGLQPYGLAPPAEEPGSSSTATPRRTGTCTSSARSSPTSRTPSASGASAT